MGIHDAVPLAQDTPTPGPFQPTVVELSPTQPFHQGQDVAMSNDSFFGDLSGVDNPLQTVPAPPVPSARRVSARWRSPKAAPGRLPPALLPLSLPPVSGPHLQLVNIRPQEGRLRSSSETTLCSRRPRGASTLAPSVKGGQCRATSIASANWSASLLPHRAQTQTRPAHIF